MSEKYMCLVQRFSGDMQYYSCDKLKDLVSNIELFRDSNKIYCSSKEMASFLNTYIAKCNSKIIVDEILSDNKTFKEQFKSKIVYDPEIFQIEGGELSLKIPKAINHIPKNTFYLDDTIKKLSIPFHIQAVDGEAFAYSNIQDLTFEKKLDNTKDLFANCKHLKKVTFEGFVKLEEDSFKDCPELEVIIVSANVVKEQIPKTLKIPDGCRIEVDESINHCMLDMVDEILEGYPEFDFPKPDSNHGNSGDMGDDFLLTREQWLIEDNPLIDNGFDR